MRTSTVSVLSFAFAFAFAFACACGAGSTGTPSGEQAGASGRADGGNSATAGQAASGGVKAGGGTGAAANGGKAGSAASSGGAGRAASGGHAANGGAGQSGAVASSGNDDDAGSPNGGLNPRGSCKRGVGYGFDPDGAVDDLRALSPGVSWYYGWADAPNSQLAKQYAALGVEFVPMVWGGSFDVDDVVSKIPDDARYLLGFNEPNFTSQANLTPQQAASLWPKLEQIASKKHLSLVSPAINYCGGGCNVTDPIDWMDQFFAACTDCKIDYLAVHWYACTGDALRSYIAMFKKYGKPIWLTEFSCGDSGTQPVSKQDSYMKDALDYLENDPDIFRYAWFSGRSTSIANVDLLAGTGKLTSLGQDYVTLPEPAACKQ
jgi:hypothetical protein